MPEFLIGSMRMYFRSFRRTAESYLGEDLENLREFFADPIEDWGAIVK
jgi:hypothetical protein